MNKNDLDLVKKELVAGRSPRAVAKTYGMNRQEVERLSIELASGAKRRDVGFYAKCIIGAVLVILVGLFFQTNFFSKKEYTDQQLKERVVKSALKLESRASRDIWSFDRASMSGTNILREAAFIEEKMDKLKGVLKKYSQIREVVELDNTFASAFRPSLFVPIGSAGISKQVVLQGSKGEMILSASPKSVEVVFFGKNDLYHPRIGGNSLAYRSDWKAVFLPSLVYSSDIWFDALFCHELWHAKMHRDGALSATAKNMSDIWIDEELASHRLEQNVLDLGTGGKYKKALASIVKSRNAPNLRQFIYALEEKDFAKLDAIFAAPSVAEVGARTSQYYFDLCSTWASLDSSNFSEIQSQQKKREIYRLLRKLSS